MYLVRRILATPHPMLAKREEAASRFLPPTAGRGERIGKVGVQRYFSSVY
jgi:hypothetical protein